MKCNLKLKTVLSLTIVALTLAGCGGGGSKPPVYHALGVGVIMQSRSAINALSFDADQRPCFDPNWKRLDFSPASLTAVQSKASSVIRLASVSDDVLNENVSFILLTWDAVRNANRYQVYYGEEIVWDSNTVNEDMDPAFEPGNPQAYLDLDEELAGRITTAGVYEFEIVALNGGVEKVRLPLVTASLGMILETLPDNITFSAPSSLTWNAVAATSEYRITLTGVAPVAVEGGLTSFDVATVLTAGPEYYEAWVDARYLDDGGNLVEVTRGIGGFDF